MSHDYATRENSAFWRSISDELFDKTNGDVETTYGWFGIVTIDDEFHHLYNWHTSEQVPEDVPDGRYFITVNSDGLIWAELFDYDEYDSASAAYARASDEYERWLTLTEEEL